MKILAQLQGFFEKKIIKDILIYGVADVTNKAIPFFLLPILTNYLSPVDYGILATFNSIFAILIIFVGLSANGAVAVQYFKLSKKELQRYIGNIIYLLLVSGIASVLLIYIASDVLQGFFDIPILWIYMLVPSALTYFLTQINLTLYIAEKDSIHFALFNLSDTLIKLSVTLALVIIYKMNWHGSGYGLIVGTFTMGILSYISLVRRGYISFKYDRSHIINALKFGLPLIPHQIGGWFRKGGIVLLLIYMVGEKQTGLYDVGVKFVLIINLVTVVIFKVYQPYLFRILATNPTAIEKRRLVIYSYGYMLFLIIFAVFISVVSPKMIEIMVGNDFQDSQTYIWNLAIASAFQGMNLMVVGYIYYENKTAFLAVNSTIFSAFQIIVAFILVKVNGPIGAAQAASISFLLSFISTWVYSTRIYQMPWLLKR